ncbi:MAG: hypothetical protein ACYTXT_33935 [Nostoc sp.]
MDGWLVPWKIKIAVMIALAIAVKIMPVIRDRLNNDEQSKLFFKKLSPENVYIVESVEQAIATAKTILS